MIKKPALEQNLRTRGLTISLLRAIVNGHIMNAISVHGLSRDSGLVCFGCYGDLDDSDDADLIVCPACGLPLCKESCQAAAQHQPECRAFQAVGHREGRDLSLSLFNDIPYLNEIVIILRCVENKSFSGGSQIPHRV